MSKKTHTPDEELDAALKKIQGGKTESQEASHLTKDEANKERLLQDLKNVVSPILHVDTANLNPDISLVSLGLDSFTASKFANTINERYHLTISPTVFFEFATLHFLVDYLYQGFEPKVMGYLDSQGSVDVSGKAPSREVPSEAEPNLLPNPAAKEQIGIELDIDTLWKQAEKDKETKPK